MCFSLPSRTHITLQQTQEWLPFTSSCQKLQQKVSVQKWKPWNETKCSRVSLDCTSLLSLTATFAFPVADQQLHNQIYWLGGLQVKGHVGQQSFVSAAFQWLCGSLNESAYMVVLCHLHIHVNKHFIFNQMSHAFNNSPKSCSLWRSWIQHVIHRNNHKATCWCVLDESVSVTHLQQQDELRKALDRFHHQTVQSDSVWTGSLFLLKSHMEKGDLVICDMKCAI